MPCTSVAFDDKRQAESVRRRILRDSHVFVHTYYCEKCDFYHLGPRAINAVNLRERDIQIVRLHSQGMTRWQICREMKMSEWTVDTVLERLRKRFFASSSSNLVAIMIALGFIDPNDFIPGLTEKLHA